MRYVVSIRENTMPRKLMDSLPCIVSETPGRIPLVILVTSQLATLQHLTEVRCMKKPVDNYKFTGDPPHNRALAHSRAQLLTKPCPHCSHNRAPGEQWARLCVFTLQGCVQAARLCRGSPVKLSIFMSCSFQSQTTYYTSSNPFFVYTKSSYIMEALKGHVKFLRTVCVSPN